MSIESRIARYFEKARVVRGYGATSKLLPPEETLFEIYRDDLGGRVLDLGCGGGRTTARLAALAKHYVGLDYSSGMVECCRQRFPDLDFVRGDAADLSMFEDGSFDFVLFSYNGLDTMSHANRLRVLREVHRVLVPGGLFAFSAHNIERRGIVVAFDRSAPLQPRALLKNMKNIVSYLRVRRMQSKTDTYSILSDPLAEFGMLSYYISKKNQVAQLEGSGFVDVRCVDQFGAVTTAAEKDETSIWIYYACRKSDVAGGAHES